MQRRMMLLITTLGLCLTGSFLHSLQAQTKTDPCSASLNFTLDDSDRPTRLEQTNQRLCAKETIRFSFAPAESGTFPFNGQTFSTDDGVTITQMFQRNTKLDLSFSYTTGQNTLRISVDRLSDMNPATKRIKLLPARFFIDLNGTSAAFVFTGQETEDELEAKAQDFFAIGRLARSAGFDKASKRITEFTKTLWGKFSREEQKRSQLPLKAAFPVTELTINIFALSFALQDQAFETMRLSQNRQTLHQSLILLSGVKEKTAQSLATLKKVSFSNATLSRSLVQDDGGGESDYAGFCCRLCYAVHALLGLSELNCICCLGSCQSCLPYISHASVEQTWIADRRTVLPLAGPRTRHR